MKLKLVVICPDEKEIIQTIIRAASEAGAGWIDKYSQCASVFSSQSCWKSEEGSHPVQGKVGKVTWAKTVKIEMPLPSRAAKTVAAAIRKVHPWEQVDIEFIRIEDY